MSEPARGVGSLAVVAGILTIAAWLSSGDEIVAGSLATLLLVWLVLDGQDDPPVLRLSLTFQWSQVTAGPLYFYLTGRRVHELDECDWRPMVWIGLGCIVTLLFGLLLGRKLVRDSRPAVAGGGLDAPGADDALLSTSALAVAYAVLSAVGLFVPQIAFSFPQLTQIIFTVSMVRYAALYLLFRRLVRPTVQPLAIGALLVFEIVIGLTGFFAGFREAFIMAGLALLEAFDRRRIAHWASLMLLTAGMCGFAVVWTGVKQEYRRAWRHDAFATSEVRKIERLEELTTSWIDGENERLLHDVDQMVSRLWAVYYPALAIARVPSVLPHTEGTLTAEGVTHILTPRVLFPEKRALESDSQMVRKYSGIWVAGTKQHTSIAFGYSGESYIDFGVPLMFVPIFLFALVLGAAHKFLDTRIHNREVAAGMVTAIFWASLYLFERSWVKLVGVAASSILLLGALGIIADRAIARALSRRQLPVRLVQLKRRP